MRFDAVVSNFQDLNLLVVRNTKMISDLSVTVYKHIN